MGPTLVDRLPSELDEMADVACHQAAPRVGRQRQLLSVRPIQAADLVSAGRVDPPPAQSDSDARAEIFIEVEPYRRRAALTGGALPASYRASFSAMTASISC